MTRRENELWQDFRVGVAAAAAMAVIMFVAACALVGSVIFFAGNDTPQQFLGVPDDHREVAEVAFEAYPEPFSVEGSDPANYAKNVRMWEVPGVRERLNPGPQQTGDCPAWSLHTPLMVRQCISVAQGKRGEITVPFPPSLYATGRVRNGRSDPPCGRAGGYPSRMIEGAKADGWLTSDEFGQPYSGALADRVGCRGLTPAQLTISRKRAGLSAYPVRSVDEWAEASVNGFPTTVAFYFSRNCRIEQRDGRSVVKLRTGTKLGNHAVCCIGYDGSSGRRYWYLFNSHGANWPEGAERNGGEPPGCCAIDEDDARWIVQTGQVWAISDVPGFEVDELDLSIFDKLN